MSDEARLPPWSVTDNALSIDFGRFNLVDGKAEPEDGPSKELAEPDWTGSR